MFSCFDKKCTPILYSINIYYFIWILYWKPKPSLHTEIIQLYTASQRQWTHYILQNLLYRNLKILISKITAEETGINLASSNFDREVAAHMTLNMWIWKY